MGKPLHFKGSTFHRVIPQFMCQVTSSQVVPCAFLLLQPAEDLLGRGALAKKPLCRAATSRPATALAASPSTVRV